MCVNSKCIINSGSQTFNFTGAAQTFRVPLGVTKLTVELWGAQGGGSAAGRGGYAKGVVTVIPNSIVYVYVGGQGTYKGGQPCGVNGGFNGGGPTGSQCCSNAGSGAGSGGGATDIRLGSTSLNARVLVAGGGGGSYRSTTSGGNGGGTTGSNGGNYNGVTATGGTQTAGGRVGGHFTNHSCSAGTNGSFGQGGRGDGNDGGGGGGGWYGGGGGPNNGNGAGGSSYGKPVTVTGFTTTAGQRTGNGQAKISW